MPSTPASMTRPLTAVACLGVYLAYFDRAVPAAAAPLIKQALGLSDARLGFAIATAAAIGYAAVAIAMARVRAVRRVDRLLIAGAVIWSGGMIALAFARRFGGYVAAELAVGAGQALYVPAAATLIAGAGDRALGRATARFTIASSLGRTSATLIGGAIIAGVLAAGLTLAGVPQAWRALFVVTALPNIGVIVALCALRVPGTAEPEGSTRPTPMPPAVRVRQAGTFLLATAPVLVIQAVGGWYPTLLVRTAGLAPADAAMAAGAAMLLAAPAGQWLGGIALDRRRDRPMGTAAAIVAPLVLAAVVLMAMAARPTLASALAALVVVDLLLGIAALAALASIQRLAPGAGRHRVNSLFFALVTLLGVGVGPLIAGRLSDLGGASGAALALALVEVAAIAVAVAASGHLLGWAGMRYSARDERGHRQGRA